MTIPKPFPTPALIDDPHDVTRGPPTEKRVKSDERKRAAALESLSESARKLSEIGSKKGVQGPPAKMHDVLEAIDTLNASATDKAKT